MPRSIDKSTPVTMSFTSSPSSASASLISSSSLRRARRAIGDASRGQPTSAPTNLTGMAPQGGGAGSLRTGPPRVRNSGDATVSASSAAGASSREARFNASTSSASVAARSTTSCGGRSIISERSRLSFCSRSLAWVALDALAPKRRMKSSKSRSSSFCFSYVETHWNARSARCWRHLSKEHDLYVSSRRPFPAGRSADGASPTTSAIESHARLSIAVSCDTRTNVPSYVERYCASQDRAAESR
mmetsp:Transcript_2446/g.7229  ORF Transcript_2446/g.7229 Transcript_2446/m.7229 type:complete len:244 (-) Transcript_2446:826-1557(-)